MSASSTVTPLQAVANQLVDSPRTPFPHPYNAYPIQQQLMSQIYTTVKRKGVGIFESPTGTGKTLSIICSALHWLKEHQEYGSDDDIAPVAPKSNTSQTNEPDWCRNFETEQAIRAKELELKRKKTVRSELNEKLDKLRGSDVLSDGNALRDAARRRRQLKEGGRPAGAGRLGGKRPREDEAQQHKAAQAGEDDQLAADYSDSETEVADGPREARQRRSAFRPLGHGARGTDKGGGLPQLSEGAARSMSIADQIRAELAASEQSAAKAAQDAERNVHDRRKGGRADGADGVPWSEEEELERAAFRPQILYVSRTHSQVTQFVHEIGKTVFGRDLRVVSLGSRKSLCVHPTVSSFASDSRINEVCLEMQDKAKRSSSTAAPPDSVAGLPSAVTEAASSTSSSIIDQVRLLKATHHDPIQAHTGPGCPFLAEPMAQNAYKDVLLARVRDVEESAALGEELKTCSYYGSRRAVKYAEVVAMPYSMLLHASTRASSGIDLRGAVVVIDEAHNVIDAINSSHASSVNSEQLGMAHATVRAYLAKYAQRMKPSNVQLCTALADAIAGILAYLAGRQAVTASMEGIQPFVKPTPSTSHHDSGARRTSMPAQASKPLEPSVAAKATPAEPVESVKMEATVPQRAVSPFASFFGGKPRPASSSAGGEGGQPSDASHSRGATPQPAPEAPSAAMHAPPAALVVPAAKPAAAQPTPVVRARSEPAPAAQLPAQRALPGDTVHSITGFHTAAGISHVNLFRVRRYVDAVELLKKLRGFAEAGARAAAAATSAGVGASSGESAGEVAIHGKPSQMKQNGGKAIQSTPESPKSPATSYMSSVTAMQQCWSFLTSLLLTDQDGRVIVTVPPHRDNPGAQQTDSVLKKKELPSARFVLLNPSLPFQEVVQKARSVILVGGTMQPVGDIVEQLFAAVPPTRMVKTFSCGHIIPRENLSCLTVAAGPSAVPFDFRHGTRGDARIIDELGRAIVSLATLVPAGIVVFLPSFDYEMSVMQHWCRNHPQAGVQELQGSVRAKAAMHASLATSASDTYKVLAQGGIPAGAPGSVLEQLQKRKAVFREPRSATQVDIVLKAYASVIATACGSQSTFGGGLLDQGTSPMDSDNESSGGVSLHSYSSHTGVGMGKGGVMSSSSSVAGGSVTSTSSLQQGVGGGGARAQTGAILFCVVGGKMSEGINFADDMARCVVVVGLPFAHPSDPELKERMEYLSRGGARAASKGAGTSTGSNKGSEYYENLCMRAVNQSIGRSIRHKDDYSLICLLDGRYAQQRIKGKLPGWIGDRIADTHTWGQVVSATAEFFRAKKAAGTS